MSCAASTQAPARRRAARAAVLLLACMAFATGCTRAMMVGSEAGPLYRVTVQNDLGEAMIVSYNDGRGDALLGTVAARSVDHFTIARPAVLRVSVYARNVAGTRNLGPITVELSPDTARLVRLQ
jgi:hypothetical protein